MKEESCYKINVRDTLGQRAVKHSTFVHILTGNSFAYASTEYDMCDRVQGLCEAHANFFPYKSWPLICTDADNDCIRFGMALLYIIS